MPKKRKNNGKNRHNRGRVGFVRCDVSGRAVPKDKAIKRFIVRNLVDSSGQKDLQDNSFYNQFIIPKMYYKACYCVSAAIHQRIGMCAFTSYFKSLNIYLHFCLFLCMNHSSNASSMSKQRRKKE